MNAAGTPYMVRAFNNEQAYIKLNSIGGLITTFGVIIFNVIFPMFYAKIIFDASGWGKLVGTIAIPLCIIGLLRFFFIPEKYGAGQSYDPFRIRVDSGDFRSYGRCGSAFLQIG